VTTPLLRAAAAAVALIAAASVAGCSTDSPKQQSTRLQKAAGLRAFEIDTTPELWKKTSDPEDGTDPDRPIKAKVTKLGNGLERVDLDGVSLANYLRVLDYHAHGGADEDGLGRFHEPEAIRMYNEIAKALDAITTRPAVGDPPPHIVVDDAFLPPTPS
jgi:hypothetical protein